MPIKTRITDARHNAETGCFEAYVTLIDGTESYTYEVACPAPIDRAPDEVQAALEARARRLHRPADCTLTRRRVAVAPPDRHADIAQRILAARPISAGQSLTRH